MLAAAGIDHVSEEEDAGRRGDILRIVPIDGSGAAGVDVAEPRRGSPVEVDYLNGEIVLLGRLHGVPTPVNELLQPATHRAVVGGDRAGHSRRPISSPSSAESIRGSSATPSVGHSGEAKHSDVT